MLRHCTANDDITIVMPIYRNPMLDLVLQGFCLQSNMNFKLIIVSDGGEDYTQIIANYANQINVEYYYQFSPANTFCAGAARNLGAFFTTTQRVVFLDGDCIPSIDFVKYSSFYSSQRMIVAGIRNRISPNKFTLLTNIHKVYQITTRCDDRYLAEPEWRRQRLIHIHQMEKGGYVYPYYCHGFSFNCLTTDFKNINGFSKSSLNYSNEDQDLAIRLCKLAGYSTLLDKNIVCYHLDHGVSKLQSNFSELKSSEANANPIRDQELILYDYERRV